jgi:hypothetical protein
MSSVFATTTAGTLGFTVTKKPAIVFNNPAMVTSSVVDVNGTPYRVFSIPGTTTPINTFNSSTPPITCTIYSESAITIYYLAVGSGGSGPSGSGYSNGQGGAGGGAGGGGFVEGSFNLIGSIVNKTIGISVGYSPTYNESNGNNTNIIINSQSINIGAGGGGAGVHAGDGRSSTPGGGNAATNNNGGGAGGGTWWNNGTGRFGGGGQFGGGRGDSISGVSGGGGGPRAKGNDGEIGGGGAAAISVASTTLGIYQRFLGTTFCGGGSGGAAKPNSYGYNGGNGGGSYGYGGAGSYNTPVSPGGTGIVALAIRLSDIPL